MSCPLDLNAAQGDLDGVGDVCDSEADGDGVANEHDLRSETVPGALVNVIYLVPTLAGGSRAQTESAPS